MKKCILLGLLVWSTAARGETLLPVATPDTLSLLRPRHLLQHSSVVGSPTPMALLSRGQSSLSVILSFALLLIPIRRDASPSTAFPQDASPSSSRRWAISRSAVSSSSEREQAQTCTSSSMSASKHCLPSTLSGAVSSRTAMRCLSLGRRQRRSCVTSRSPSATSRRSLSWTKVLSPSTRW